MIKSLEAVILVIKGVEDEAVAMVKSHVRRLSKSQLQAARISERRRGQDDETSMTEDKKMALLLQLHRAEVYNARALVGKVSANTRRQVRKRSA